MNDRNNRLYVMEIKKNQVAGYHKFLKKYSRNKDNPICFVEGEDEKYYYLRVKLRCENNDPLFINCENKEGVLNTFNKINGKQQFNELRLLYFVDSDFDPKINNPLIYETPYHSIENFYTSYEVVKKILRNEYNISEDEDDWAVALSLYIDRQEEFHKAMLVLNAWLACQHDLRNYLGIKDSRLNLKNLKLKELVSISLEEVKSKYDLATLDSLFPEAYKISEDILSRKIAEFEKRNMQQIFRGKFEVEFLAKFLDLVKEDLGKNNPCYFSKRKKVSINIQSVISQFSNYAETSQCLINYIDAIWEKRLQTA